MSDPNEVVLVVRAILCTLLFCGIGWAQEVEVVRTTRDTAIEVYHTKQHERLAEPLPVNTRAVDIAVTPDIARRLRQGTLTDADREALHDALTISLGIVNTTRIDVEPKR